MRIEGDDAGAVERGRLASVESMGRDGCLPRAAVGQRLPHAVDDPLDLPWHWCEALIRAVSANGRWTDGGRRPMAAAGRGGDRSGVHEPEGAEWGLSPPWFVARV